MRDRPQDDPRTHEGIEAFINGPAVRRVRRVADDPSAALATAGLDSPEAWDQAVRLEDDRVSRYRRPATIVAFELLTRGVDPAALVEPVGQALRREARETDRLTWAGDGRFRALLPETDEDAAIVYAERAHVAARAVAAWLAGPRAVTDIRVAVCGAVPGRSLATAIIAAERTLSQDGDDAPLDDPAVDDQAASA